MIHCSDQLYSGTLIATITRSQTIVIPEDLLVMQCDESQWRASHQLGLLPSNLHGHKITRTLKRVVGERRDQGSSVDLTYIAHTLAGMYNSQDLCVALLMYIVGKVPEIHFDCHNEYIEHGLVTPPGSCETRIIFMDKEATEDVKKEKAELGRRKKYQNVELKYEKLLLNKA